MLSSIHCQTEIENPSVRLQEKKATSIAKVIEVLAEGGTVEDAVETVVRSAPKTVRGIRHVYVEGIQALVEGDQVRKYRINAKVTFVVEESD